MSALAPTEPPDWVADAVFYQIFPDRFARSERVPKPHNLQPWGSAPTTHGFQGGDLLGIVEHLDHLHALGVNAIYLNPIFMSASNHRYHTYDYYRVDPLLGGNEALRELLDAAHARGMRVILDGVFNHASRGFWAFHHILECGPESPYIDWFEIYGFPLHAYESREKPNYAAWWNLPALPKFNINNREVWDYLLGVGEYWMRFGIDGWRLDVPEEITVEGFWEAFRARVKGVRPDAYLVGEIWTLAPEWVTGNRFDGLMNYPLSITALNFLAADTLRTEFRSDHFPLTPLTGLGALKKLEQIFETYPETTQRAQLNVLDTHDTPRFLTAAGGDITALHLAAIMQMTLPGAPSIYYGTEIGLEGGRDPDCRRAFPWDRARWRERTWEWFQEAVRLRHAQPALRRGQFTPLVGQDVFLAYLMQLEREAILLAFNAGRQEENLTLSLPAGRWGGGVDLWRLDHEARAITLPPPVITHDAANTTTVTLKLPARGVRVVKLLR
jgi:neopullulanase